jgi:hypothetical protein
VIALQTVTAASRAIVGAMVRAALIGINFPTSLHRGARPILLSNTLI